MSNPDARSLSDHDPETERSDATPIEETETFQVLLSLAHRKTGAIPTPLLVRHVLAVTGEADLPVQRAAMEAVLRRCQFGKQDGLEVASRPPRGAPFGIYATRRAGSSERPYTTMLERADPIGGSCDCPDFLRNSLGICKHLLVVLDDMAPKLDQILAAQGNGSRTAPRLVWDPVRPLTGAGDWLDRLHLVNGGEPRANGSDSLAAAKKWFRRDGRGSMVLKSTYATEPHRRLDLVNDLGRLVGLEQRRRADRQPAAAPALRALFAAEKERLDRLTANRAAAPMFKRALQSLKRQLYPYQIEGFERILQGGRLLLADDMGLGKTAQAIAACHALWFAGKVRRGLLIVPASLKPQWEREWQLFTDAPVAVVEGQAAQRKECYRTHSRGFLIANYEQVLRDLEHMHAWRPEIVVLDEAQRIKNWATKTAAYVKKLRPPYRLVLTGTPMENRLEELASLLDWVDDLALEPKWRLAPWHSTFCDGSKEVSGARHLDTLRVRLSGCMVRRVRSEVLRQLPPRTDTVVPVEITDEQAGEHAALNQPIAQLVAIARRRPLTQAQFLRLMSLLTTQRIIANGLAQLQFARVWPAIADGTRPEPALLRSLSSPKLLELREILAQVAIEQQRKVVVFSQWRRMLKLAHWAVTDLLAESGVRAVFFTGKEGAKQRTNNLVEFHDDPNTRVLFASDAGGVGLNLQRAASCCVNIELPWNPAVLEQRIGRIYRLGQKRPIDVYNLVTEFSIESRIAALVSDKRALFTGLFDGASDEVRFDRSGSFLSRLEKIVEPVTVPDLPEDAAVQEAETSADRELDEMVSAADESQDAAPVLQPEQTAQPNRVAPPESLPSAVELTHLLAQLSIRSTNTGNIVIEAPPDAAASLAGLFEGMARMLRQSEARAS